jgi:hypothetical protein
MSMLQPTSEKLRNENHRPDFLWWLNCTVGQFKEFLASNDVGTRAYYLGASLREANTRDVWIFTTPDTVKLHWRELNRYLGKSRERWAYLLDMPVLAWPPKDAF